MRVSRQVAYISGKTCRPPVGQLSANKRLTVSQLSADRRPTVDRQSADRFFGSSSSQLPRILVFHLSRLNKACLLQTKIKLKPWIPTFFLFSRMNNYLYLKFLYLLTLRLLTYIHHPKELLNNYPSSTLTRHAVLTNCLHMYWKRYLNLLLDGLLLFFSNHLISTRSLQIVPRPISLLFIRKTINLFPQITNQSL